MIDNLIKKNKVFIVAEIGNNHEGSFDVAKKLIEKAALSGVDAVKFQTFQPKYYVNVNEVDRLKRLEKFRLSYDQFHKLFEIAKDHNVIFFSTPFDVESAVKLNEFQELFKISSGDNTFYPLIKTVAKFKKPTFISTGLSSLESLNKIVSLWSENGEKKFLSLLHCVASYPVPENEANLNYIKILNKKFSDLTIGYSDHTLGIDATIYSVILGAKIVEKHFTLDKNFSNFHDHKISANPKEMKELVTKINNVFNFIGEDSNQIQNCEKDNIIALRRSIAARLDLKKDSILNYEDLTWVRPGTGFSPGEENKLLGKKIRHNINQGQIFTFEDFY